MSSEQIAALAVDSRIKDIAEYISEQVITPAEGEAGKIIRTAEEKREQILEDARKEADRIMAAARDEAAKTQHTMEASLRIAAKQAIDSLRFALEKEVLTETVAVPVKDALKKEEVIKDLISEVVRLFLATPDHRDAAIVLSEPMREALNFYIQSDVLEKTKQGLVLSDERVPAGFRVVLTDSGMSFDFTPEALTELMAAYLRPAMRKYLFAQ